MLCFGNQRAVKSINNCGFKSIASISICHSFIIPCVISKYYNSISKLTKKYRYSYSSFQIWKLNILSTRIHVIRHVQLQAFREKTEKIIAFGKVKPLRHRLNFSDMFKFSLLSHNRFMFMLFILNYILKRSIKFITIKRKFLVVKIYENRS